MSGNHGMTDGHDRENLYESEPFVHQDRRSMVPRCLAFIDVFVLERRPAESNGAH